jgi:ribosome-binding protein aMBF1 (putative translation factor)
MASARKQVQKESIAATSDRTARDESIARGYSSQPSPRALSESGRIDRQAGERAERVRASGPPARPFRELVAALRAERERQGLSLADLAQRTGMDRAAIHKLEIGLNSNPTHATLTRYASALGARIEWHLTTIGTETRTQLA